MASTLIPIVLQQMAVVIDREMQQEVTLVCGAKKEAEKLKITLESIEAVLSDAEKRQVKEEAVKHWVEKLKDISYDMDDVMDEWSTAILKAQISVQDHNNTSLLKKVCFSSYMCSLRFCFTRLVSRRKIALKIKGLNGRIDAIARDKDIFHFDMIKTSEESERPRTTSIVDESEICGRDNDRDTLVGYLTCEGEGSQVERSLQMISIEGMGGIGKTTLAQLAFNDDKVKAWFEIRVWVCVSDPFDEIRIAKAIIEAVEGKASNIIELETLLQQVRGLIEGKKFFIVLDDVWTEDYQKWEPLKNTLKCGDQGSKVLVTTRKAIVATMMRKTRRLLLGKLSEEDCWLLFSQIAFSEKDPEERKELEDLGREIAYKCKGLPLAAKTLASLMRLKNTREEWQEILESKIWELEEAEIGIFPPLLFSYYDLPSSIRRCFSYCAVFPKDHKIVKNELIKLWMAQGFLNSRGSRTEMESTGRDYFENLARRSFFQDFEKDKVDGSIQRCKMHDIVHDFAQFLTKNECIIIGVDGVNELSTDSYSRKARHSTVMVAAPAPFPSSICNAVCLRTLLVRQDDSRGIASALPNICLHLTCLRALNLRNSLIEEVPDEVGKLIHLRYLNLSNNNLKVLPETVSNLCNLQTLNLSGCQCLQKLPQGIGRLIKLRHLEIDRTLSLHVLPKGIGRLRSLQTLSRFIISGSNVSDACKIEDLKNLNCLRRKLLIEGLGKVSDVGDAEKARLREKKHLLGLELRFTRERVERRKDKDVLEALQPHSELEHMSIYHYKGTTVFPSWMMLLSKLRSLSLNKCEKCISLPALGKLQSLEKLGLFDMDSVKMVGVEFLGLESVNGGLVSSQLILFPQLKELSFYGMIEWEEWKGVITRRREGDGDIRIMPCLRSLVIYGCPKLKGLPQYIQTTKPQELIIYGCPFLKKQYLERIGENWDKISHIPSIQIDDLHVQKDGHCFKEAESI